jgi:hypothetical protein
MANPSKPTLIEPACAAGGILIAVIRPRARPGVVCGDVRRCYGLSALMRKFNRQRSRKAGKGRITCRQTEYAPLRNRAAARPILGRSLGSRSIRRLSASRFCFWCKGEKTLWLLFQDDDGDLQVTWTGDLIIDPIFVGLSQRR